MTSQETGQNAVGGPAGFVQRLRTRYLPSGSLRSRWFTGTSWMLLGNGIAQGVSFIVMILAARMLGSDNYGKYGIIQSTMAVFAIVAGAGMGVTNRRYVAELRVRDPQRCGEIVALSAVVTAITAGVFALVLAVSAPWIAARILKAPDLTSGLQLAALILFLSALNEAQVGALSGLEKFRTIAQINFVRALTYPVLVLGGTRLWGLTGLVAGLAVSALLVWVLSRALLTDALKRAGLRARYAGVKREKELLIHFVLPALASAILPALVFWAARAIFVQRPNGYSELGVFSAAEQWLIVLAFVPGQISNVSQPILSSIYGTGNRSRLRTAAIANILLPVGIAAATAVAVILLANPVASIYGRSFTGLSAVLVWVCLVGILRVFGGAVGTLLVTINRMWISLGINLIWGAILLAATVLLAARGAIGLAAANLIAYSVHSLLGLVVFYLYTRRSHETSSLSPVTSTAND